MQNTKNGKYHQVADRVISLIEGGTLKPGEKIPSLRKMARQMDMSLMTVLNGYRLLESRGIVEAFEKSGFVVRSPDLWDNRNQSQTSTIDTHTLKIRSTPVRIADAVDALLDDVSFPDMVALGCGIPHPEHFPSDQLSLHLARASRTYPMQSNQYCLTPGDARLRQQISLRMMNCGCTTAPDQVVITAGATSAIHLCLRAVCSHDDLVAVESPGYFGFFKALEYLGLRAIEIPSNAQSGLCVDSFENIAKNNNIRALVLSADISNPSGAAMNDEHKQKLIQIARKHDIAIIDDDTYGETCFKKTRSVPLKSLDNDNVLHVGSFSKTLCPGYRLGWAAGGKYHDELIKLHRMAALATTTPIQLAVASYLASGSMDRHLRKLRSKYADNITMFRREITAHLGAAAQLSNPHGGHFLWVRMPDRFDSIELSQKTKLKGISICPGMVFSAQQNYQNYFRLNCALPWSDKIRQSLKTICQLAGELL